MSIMAWLLAIMARESSEGISPTVRTCCARAIGTKADAVTAAVPSSSFLRFIMVVSSGLRCMESSGRFEGQKYPSRVFQSCVSWS
ncbi:hypothetical protein D3C72_1878640 [compost metagenome]